ncbi:unnamed protein product [Rangifer tarandus platyrhynchus]|uniref:Uncharacterized protein n=2 Tax=Rangifer tarandus platyrhynchus TaxID=3082113 RepID=A0AC60A2H4_RANTA|nr:unnamed protein product [Rangifer tarandus platyrhynchus]
MTVDNSRGQAKSAPISPLDGPSERISSYENVQQATHGTIYSPSPVFTVTSSNPTDDPHCMEKELMVSLQAHTSKAQTFDQRPFFNSFTLQTKSGGNRLHSLETPLTTTPERISQSCIAGNSIKAQINLCQLYEYIPK